jgi:hypothetical protein
MDEKQLEGKRVYWSSKWDKLWLLIIPVGFLIEALTNPNHYNLFWFWVIIICALSFTIFILYHMFHPKFVWVDTMTTEGKKIQAKATELIFSDFGIFTYYDNGFEFTEKGQTHSFLWADIQSIFAYKRDLYTVDELNLDIFAVNNFRLHLSEEIPGWYQFLDKIKQNFPTIDKEFEAALMFPPFATNMTLVYDSNGRTLEDAMKQYYS